MDTLADRLADRCLELCSISSVTGEEAKICDHVVEWARGLLSPKEITRHGHSLVLRCPPRGDAGERGEHASTGRPIIALVGHLDTVPPHEGDPAPSKTRDRIKGLGSSDMKGGVAVAMTLFEDLCEADIPYELVLILYEREEGPFLENGLRTLLEEVPFLRKIDFAVVLEPTDEQVQMGCLGSLHATLSFEGKSAHSARPWQGRNAITAAGAFLAEMDAREPVDVVAGGLTFREVFSVTLASGGRFRNVVPHEFKVNLNYRFAPGKSIETAKQELMKLVGGRAGVSLFDLAPSARVPTENPHLQHFLEITGRKAGPKQAWTDVAQLSEAGIDAVNCGPGLTSQAHQAREYCPISSLVAAYEDLRSFLQR